MLSSFVGFCFSVFPVLWLCRLCVNVFWGCLLRVLHVHQARHHPHHHHYILVIIINIWALVVLAVIRPMVQYLGRNCPIVLCIIECSDAFQISLKSRGAICMVTLRNKWHKTIFAASL